MFDIEETLRMMPGLSIGILAVVLAALEARDLRSCIRTGPGDSFVSPGCGYEYYVNASTVVYLQERGRTWRVYLVSGDAPVAMRRDRFGSYFTLSCANSADAEEQVDRIFRR